MSREELVQLKVPGKFIFPAVECVDDLLTEEEIKLTATELFDVGEILDGMIFECGVASNGGVYLLTIGSGQGWQELEVSPLIKEVGFGLTDGYLPHILLRAEEAKNFVIQSDSDPVVTVNKDGELTQVNIPNMLHMANQDSTDPSVKITAALIRQIAEETEGYVTDLLLEEGYNPDYSAMKGSELRMGILNMKFDDQGGD